MNNLPIVAVLRPCQTLITGLLSTLCNVLHSLGDPVLHGLLVHRPQVDVGVEATAATAAIVLRLLLLVLVVVVLLWSLLLQVGRGRVVGRHGMAGGRVPCNENSQNLAPCTVDTKLHLKHYTDPSHHK